MPSGQYIIDDGKGNKGHADTSFRACVIVLLIFLLFCVTIIIILLVVKKDAGTGSSAKDEHGGAASKYTGDEAEKSTTPPDSERKNLENKREETTSVSPPPTPTPVPEGNTAANTSTIPLSTETTHGDHTVAGSKYRSSSEANNKSTEYPTTTASTEHHSFSEERRSSEDEVKSTANITTTSTEYPEKTSTEHSDSTGLHRTSEDRNETTGHLSSTSTELPTSSSTEHSAFSEERRSSESEDKSTGHVTSTSSEHPLSTSEPPITPPAPSLPPPSVDPVPCESVKCKKLAANMLNTMGHGVDPCKQFYEFACGGLRENKYLLEPVYEDEAWQRINSEVNKLNESDPESYRKFKTLEESCNNYDPAKDIKMWKEAVHTEMMDLGAIAVEDTDFSENFTHLFLGLLQHDRPFIFEVTLDINDTEPSRFAVKIFPAQMMETQLYPEDNGALECQAQAAQKYKHLTLIYEESLKCMTTNIGRSKAMEIARKALLTLGSASTPAEEEKLNKTLDDYGEFLDSNAQALGDRRTRQWDLQEREPDIKTLKEMDIIFGALNIKWSTIIEKLIGRPLREDEPVQLYSTIYFRAINEKYGSRRRQLNNALLVSFAAARYHDLVAVQQRWRRVLHPRHCTRLAAHLLPDVASALYLRSFSAKHRGELELQGSDFVYDISNTFFSELDRASWLAEDAYKALKDSLEYKFVHMKMGNATDTPELMDAETLDVALQNYTIKETHFIGNAINLMARNRKRLYRRIDDEPMNHIWTHFVAPYDTAGKSLYSLSVFAIPFGAVEEPFFNAEYLPHIRMAGYGFEVAHEMAHHIDSTGIYFNTTSTKSTNEDYIQNRIPRMNVYKHDVNIEYLNLTGPNKHQNVFYEFSDTDYFLKNKEYFADKIGITLAYKTYKRTQKKKAKMTLPYLSLTNDQSFFVFLAQKYCTKMDFFSLVLDFFESPQFPPETRIKNLMDDNIDFYKAFNCSVTEKTDRPFPYSQYVISDEVKEGRVH